MGNVLLEKVDYKITETERGIWRRYMYPTGSLYAEYTSRSMAFGMPLIHYVRGVSPETGVAPVARGVIAIGRRAVGIVAIGRFAVGLLAVGQLSAGLIGIGQLTGGVLSLGQMALASRWASVKWRAVTSALRRSGSDTWCLPRPDLARTPGPCGTGTRKPPSSSARSSTRFSERTSVTALLPGQTGWASFPWPARCRPSGPGSGGGSGWILRRRTPSR